MADVNYNIVIEIKGGDSANEEKRAVAQTQNGEDAQESGLDTKKLLKAAGIGIGIRSANAIISHEIGMTELRTGHSTYQKKLQFMYSTASQVLTVAAGIGISIATQNPLGIIAAAGTVLNTAMSYAFAAEELSLSRSLEAVTLRQTYIRAGVGGYRNDRFR